MNANSFYTKRAGCNSAEDRVIVENGLRPQYADYINLDVGEGIRGNLYENNMYYQNAGVNNTAMRVASEQAGHFGGVFSPGTTEANCSYGAYENAQVQQERSRHPRQIKQQPCGRREHFVNNNAAARTNARLTNGFRSCKFTSASGF